MNEISLYLYVLNQNNMNTQTITRQELINLLMVQEKGTFTNVLMETKVIMNKKDNPYFDKVIKRSKCNYLLGSSYEQRVNTNYEKEGIEETFVTEKPSGKTHISKCLLVKDTDTNIVYVQLERFDEIKPTNEYIFEGNPIEKVMFESFMKKVYESTKQLQERKVSVITPNIDNIKEMSLNGTRYIIQ